MQVSAEWLKERQTGIGGSDAAAVLGLSKYKTPCQVFLEKKGQGELLEDNAPMKWGRALEPVIRQEYSNITGRAVRVPDHIIRHEKFPFMLANLDGFTDDRRIFEAKTSRQGQGWGESGSDEIPQEYLLQVQHYMTVTGYPVADVAVLIGGNDFRLYEIPADRELQDMLIQGEADFWSMVKNNTPPEPISYQDAVARYGKSQSSGTVYATPEMVAATIILKNIKDELKRLEDKKSVCMAEIMIAMGNADTLELGGNVLATWKTPKPTVRFDSKALKESRPEVYEEFLVEGESSRRFLLK